MKEFEITCIVHDDKDVIVNVGVGEKVFSVQEVVGWIQEGRYGFYTNKDGKRVEVYVKEHPESRRLFLTTDPDDTKINNLDFLPYCK